MQKQTTLKECLAELVGTFLLIFIGDMAVGMAVHTGSMDLWGVSCLWGLAVTFAVYAVGSVSGAHLNPAVTIAMALYRKFPWSKVLPYALFQIAGAFLAAGVVYFAWSGFMIPTADKLGVIIGQPGSQKLMSIFSAFYPNPGIVGTDLIAFAKVSALKAFLVEMGITATLVFLILSLTEDRHDGAPKSNLVPWFVGLIVAALVSVAAPLTMAAMNPARDLGPRLFSYLAGFGSIAFPGPRGNEWWLFILGPISGGILGGLIYESVVRPLFGASDLKADQGLDVVERDLRKTID
ncbi:MAG: aquaporin family protein [Deltaproteobacteria bacterium]|nr:aquaporin family protein [Deltaproteobacteria bacterium]